METRSAEGGSEKNRSSVEGITRNIWTSWLRTIVQCYFWKRSVLELSWDWKTSELIRCGQVKMTRGRQIWDMFPESQNGQITEDTLPEKSPCIITVNITDIIVFSKVMHSVRRKRQTVCTRKPLLFYIHIHLCNSTSPRYCKVAVPYLDEQSVHGFRHKPKSGPAVGSCGRRN